MKSSREYWPAWADTLRRYQLHEWASAVLEAGSPITLLGAQALYFSGGIFRNEQITALAQTLEEDGEANDFASYLVQKRT